MKVGVFKGLPTEDRGLFRARESLRARAEGVGWRLLSSLIAWTTVLALSLPARAQNSNSSSDSTDSADVTSEPHEGNPEPDAKDLPSDSGPLKPPDESVSKDTPDSGMDVPTDTNFGGRAGPNYVIGPEDVLSLTVFDVPELKDVVCRVGNDGTISLPLLGEVKAAGLTSDQLRKELEEKWGEDYLQNPQVTIFVKQFRGRPVSIIGAVEKPGLYPLTASRTLIEMLSLAGGLGKKATGVAGRWVYITRAGGFKDPDLSPGMHLVAPDKLEIELSRLLYSQDPSLNIEIQPLDIISVAKAPVIYVVGEVKKSGGFVLEDRDKVTVIQALAMAEGLYGNPSKRAARIIRRKPDGSTQEIPLNLGKVLKGKAPDVEMAANDILFVPTSGSRAAAKQATSSAIATISGLIIWRY